MNKVGKKDIFDNINLEIDFTLNDMFEHFDIDDFKFQNGNFLNSDKRFLLAAYVILSIPLTYQPIFRQVRVI